jgi:hypothetical protein
MDTATDLAQERHEAHQAAAEFRATGFVVCNEYDEEYETALKLRTITADDVLDELCDSDIQPFLDRAVAMGDPSLIGRVYLITRHCYAERLAFRDLYQGRIEPKVDVVDKLQALFDGSQA